MAAGAAASISAARGISQLGLFAAYLLVARRLGPSHFGEYALLLAVAAVLVNGLGSGLPILAQRETAAGRANRSMFWQLTGVLVAVTAGGTVAAAIAGMLLLGGMSGFVDGLAAGTAFILFCSVAFSSSLNTGLGRYTWAAIGESLVGLAVPAATWIALAVNLGVLTALLGLVVGILPGTAFLFLGARPLLEVEGAKMRRPFHDALPFIAIGLANAGYARVDTIALRLVSTADMVGIYAAATRLFGPMQFLASGFGTVFFSKLSARGSLWRPLHLRGRRLLALALIPVAAVVAAMAPWLVPHLFGRGYGGAIGPTQLLMLSVVPFSWYLPSAHALNARGRERKWTLILVAGLLLDASAVLLLGARFGATGAAWAWVVSQWLVMILVGRALAHVEPVGDQNPSVPDVLA